MTRLLKVNHRPCCEKSHAGTIFFPYHLHGSAHGWEASWRQKWSEDYLSNCVIPSEKKHCCQVTFKGIYLVYLELWTPQVTSSSFYSEKKGWHWYILLIWGWTFPLSYSKKIGISPGTVHWADQQAFIQMFNTEINSIKKTYIDQFDQR